MDTMDSIFEEARHLADVNNGVVYDRLVRRLSKQISRKIGPLPPTCDYRATRRKLRQKERRIESFADKRDLSFEKALSLALEGCYANTYLPIVARRYLYHERRLMMLIRCDRCLSCLMDMHGICGLQSASYTRRTARIRSKQVMKSINSAMVAEPDLNSAFAELISEVAQPEKVNCG